VSSTHAASVGLNSLSRSGNALIIASTTSTIIALTWGGVTYPWQSWHVLTPLICGVVGIFLFLAYEGTIAKYPVVRDSFGGDSNVLTRSSGAVPSHDVSHGSFWLRSELHLAPCVSSSCLFRLCTQIFADSMLGIVCEPFPIP
jgi:hypothetical protein